MVDFSSQQRLYGPTFRASHVADSVHSFKEQYRDQAPRSFKTPRTARKCSGALQLKPTKKYDDVADGD